MVDHYQGEEREKIEAFLKRFDTSSEEEIRALLKKATIREAELPITNRDRKKLKKVYRQELVKRRHLYRIAAAWVITVPASAFLGAMMFFYYEVCFYKCVKLNSVFSGALLLHLNAV